MNRYLMHAAKKQGLRLAWIDGGSLRNAIPRESFAIITIPAANEAKFKECQVEYAKTYASEFSAVEPTMKFVMEPTTMPAKVIDLKTQDVLFKSIHACPNGVMRMSDDMKGLVETSTNLARRSLTPSLGRSRPNCTSRPESSFNCQARRSLRITWRGSRRKGESIRVNSA